ncbi:uncharacterized protein LOC141590085 [Silene latifolia]|uniref:uncharacterized protein LOC141590085 n=1 Tax=Silene latifolia TaxID=37657 RepID=UPI003D772F4D
MVYAFNDVNERNALWSDLGAYSRSFKGPWVICGDFNTVLIPSERLGGNSTFEEMDDFQRCVSDCGVLRSLCYWDNASAYAHFYNEGTFNHTPCVVQTLGDFDKPRRSFKYYNMWSKAADFKTCVLQTWAKDWGGSQMFNLVKKLKSVKWPLKQLNKDNFDDIVNNTARARINLEFIQMKLRDVPLNIASIEQEVEACSIVRFLDQACHDFLCKNLKPPGWTREMTILGIFTTSLRQAGCVKLSSQVIRMRKVCTSAHRVLLMSPVSDDEIKKAMFSIPSHKAAGPDGYSHAFFRDA